ncbi:MAG: YabP/YqfC family sporulation protein [Oscillospiraceae bacterium]|nr:YabP/YqfC family sporulation protein [Oscillospiraceae bacterium]
MKNHYKALGRMTQLTGLPLEYAAGLPKVELEGFTTARVECHRGVLQYSENIVELGGKGAKIRISGSGLGLKALSPALAVITGRISGAEYIFGEDGE